MKILYRRVLIAVLVLTLGFWVYFGIFRYQQKANAKYGAPVQINEAAFLAKKIATSPRPTGSGPEMKETLAIEKSIASAPLPNPVPNPSQNKKEAPSAVSSPVSPSHGKTAVLVASTVSTVPENDDHLSTPTVAELKSRIANIKGENFSGLINSLSEQFGVHAVDGLVEIASDQSLPLSQRYIALMSSVKLGGAGTIPSIQKMTEDENPFIRRGLCLACRVVVSPACISFAERLSVDDPALIVRDACVDGVIRNAPSSRVFEKVLLDPRNHTKSTPLPILYKALGGLSGRDQSALASLCQQLSKPYSTPDWQEKVGVAIAKISTQSGAKSLDTKQVCERYRSGD